MTPKELFSSDYPLKPQVTERLPWLFQELGFRIASDFYSRNEGCSEVTLESAALWVHFHSDRGAISVSVASPAEPEHWMELGFLWKALKDIRPNPGLEGWAWFLRDHLADLEDALGQNLPQTKQAWERQLEESRLSAAAYLRPTSILGRIFLPQVVHRARRIIRWSAVVLFAWIVWLLFQVK